MCPDVKESWRKWSANALIAYAVSRCCALFPDAACSRASTCPALYAIRASAPKWSKLISARPTYPFLGRRNPLRPTHMEIVAGAPHLLFVYLRRLFLFAYSLDDEIQLIFPHLDDTTYFTRRKILVDSKSLPALKETRDVLS